MNTTLILGDNKDELRQFGDNSFDSVVCDPPYGISFMGNKWDYEVPSVELWEEVLRVLKPGGHLLAFGGTKTQHRMCVNIEDAGFEIRDMIAWIYGTGFPKSLNIGKAVDKKLGNKREVIGRNPNSIENCDKSNTLYESGTVGKTDMITKGSSEWEGWGTALKPALEPITLARKPLNEKTIVDNVLKWNTGGLNIDSSRINIVGKDTRSAGHRTKTFGAKKVVSGGEGSPEYIPNENGRHPANLIHDGIVDKPFFYCAKASKKERGTGNNHPTVKPIALMEYLVRLITPPGGTVLDPFMGSGSTGVACKALGFNFVGIELDEHYYGIAQGRIQ